MSYGELLLTALGLSMDAFAVSVCRGLSMKKNENYKNLYLMALFFGLFQALMPLIGWLTVSVFEEYINGIDHWIAFSLLGFIGGKMIYSSFCDTPSEGGDDIFTILLLAVATSIDALAVGITLAFLDTAILGACCIIGTTAFLVTLIGITIGRSFGSGMKERAELAGGIILILIGLKILLEHLEIISL